MGFGVWGIGGALMAAREGKDRSRGDCKSRESASRDPVTSPWGAESRTCCQSDDVEGDSRAAHAGGKLLRLRLRIATALRDAVGELGE